MKSLPKKAPDWMNREQRAEYVLMLPLFEEVGANMMDHAAVYGYCVDYVQWKTAVYEMESGEGAVIETPKGQLQINPWHSVAKQAKERVEKAYKELLITPGARKRLNVEMAKAKLKDGFFDA